MLSKNQFETTAAITIALAGILAALLLMQATTTPTALLTAETPQETSKSGQCAGPAESPAVGAATAVAAADDQSPEALFQEKEEDSVNAQRQLQFTEKTASELEIAASGESITISFHSINPAGIVKPAKSNLKEMEESAGFSTDHTVLGSTAHKWGYRFKLPNQEFQAGALVEATSRLTVLDANKGKMQTDFAAISFEDVLAYGFSVETTVLSATSAIVSISKDYKSEGIAPNDWVYIDPTTMLVTEVVSTESTGTSGHPAIAVDDANVYIVWYDTTDYGGSGTDYDIFFKTKGKTGSWGTNTEVVSTESTGDSYNPAIAVDDANIYIAWQDTTNYGGAGTDYDIFFKTRSKTGSWGTNTQVVSTESTSTSSRPAIAVDDANIYIAWDDTTNYGGSGTDKDIFFKTKSKIGGLGSNDINWAMQTQVVSTESTKDSEGPVIVVDDTNIYIAWYDLTNYAGSGTTDYDIFFKTKSKTRSWGTNTQVVSTESRSHAARLAMAVDDANIYIVWDDSTNYGGAGTDNDIFFKTKSKIGGLASNDINWANPTQVVSTESTSTSYSPAIADDDANIYIAWYDFTDYGGPGSDVDILFKTRGKTDALASNDINWASATQVVSTESTGAASNPDLNVYGGVVYVVWEDGTGFDGTDTDIVFRSFSPPTLPLVSITAPTAAATYGGAVTVSATASDDSGIQDVSFYYATDFLLGATGTLICSDSSSPYSCSWDTIAVPDRQYKVKAIATAVNGDKEQDFLSRPFFLDNNAYRAYYDFLTCSNCWAFEDGDESLPLNSLYMDANTAIGANTSIELSDDTREEFGGDVGEYEIHQFIFNVSEDPATITDLNFWHEGYSDTDPSGINLYAYNFDTGSYELLGSHSSSSDDIAAGSITSDFNNYIGSDGNVFVIAESPAAVEMFNYIYTDYVRLTVSHDTIPDVNITAIDSRDISNALPFFSYAADQNLTIDFNVFDIENDRLTVDINYSTSNSQGSGTVIVSDLNLTTAVCPSQKWDDNVSRCSWDWNISGVGDNNYYILIYATGYATSDFNTSSKAIGVDNNAPVTVDNDFNNT
ncbi:MAG: Ig-like domain-containing protein, partial [Candidatus Diapherotrites archaeon]|nr:Ig-like domain-containing protein [Candidatus Diapherotrites archaeon]